MYKILKYRKAREKLSLREKVGQLFMPAAFINDTEEEIIKLEALIREHCIGGLCFFHSRASAATNYEGEQEIAYNENSLETLKALIHRYQTAAEHPLLIAIDAEWGLAMRVENTPQYPYAITLGAIQDDNGLIFEVGRHIAKDCKSAGIHWNFAPVADINDNPDNPVIGYRSFGGKKEPVTEKSLAYIKGMQTEGILTSIKHFPGHGDTTTDSHLGLPIIEKSKEELVQNELSPFQKLIDEGVDSVMVGHLSVPALAQRNGMPSSISENVIKGILRNDMGFEGVVVSDALNMHAVSKRFPKKGQLEWLAFDAGNDVLCFAEHTPEGIKMILKNASEFQIDESFERVWKLKEKAISNNDRSARPSRSSQPRVGPKTASNLERPNGLNRELAEKSLTLFKGPKHGKQLFPKDDFIGISNIQFIQNHFFKELYKDQKFNTFKLMTETIGKEENILLALFPPKAKPTDNFGFSEEQLSAINTLIESKNVVLYLFGNPYVLNRLVIKKAKAIVIAYQDFEVFQRVAANHFLGKVGAKGKLPVTISP